MSKEIPTEADRLYRLMVYAVASVLVIIMLSIVSCTMHSNAYEPELEAAMTEQVIAEAEVAKIRVQAEADKLKTLKELIDSGVNPVAARCAITGWSGSTDAGICERAASTLPK